MSTEKTLAPQIFGADEINAVVLDPGSYSTQFGFAGYDQPLITTPSYFGARGDDDVDYVFNESTLFNPTHKPDLKINPILKYNKVVNWDAAQAHWEKLGKELSVQPDEQPLLHTESPLNSFENRKKGLEVALEGLGYCGYYAVKQPTCVSFAHGRPNCLIVDIGHDLITVTPVVDGLCLNKMIKGTAIAGNFINKLLEGVLEKRGVEYVAPWQVKSKTNVEWENKDTKPVWEKKDIDMDDSVKNFIKMRTLREMKETVVECCFDGELAIEPTSNDTDGDVDMTKDDFKLSDTELLEKPSKSMLDASTTRFFELPNGLSIPFTLRERQLLGNSLFTPDKTILGDSIVEGWENPQLRNGNIRSFLVNSKDIQPKEYVPLRRSKKGEEEDLAASKEKIGESCGLTQLVQSVLNSLDIDLKPQMANNIILTGSTSLITNLSDRLAQELTLLNPSMKIRVHAAGNSSERKYGAWNGGSILASLGTFHQLWVSKAEWEEVGPERLVVSRFR
ncbi:Arp4 protein [Martiniozyma asiatica (nom. inval.)]|nr:Arp4 protein [Martiniozyma asiatica]